MIGSLSTSWKYERKYRYRYQGIQKDAYEEKIEKN